MARRFIYAAILLLGLLATWYFFLRAYNYRVTFKINNPKGVVYEQILRWNDLKPKSQKVVSTVNKTPFTKIEQDYRPSQDSIIGITWQLKKVNDSITKVSGYFTDKNSSFGQKAKMLFSKTDFVKRSLNFAKNLRQFIHFEIKSHKISGIDTISMPSKKALYTSVKTTTSKKAQKMIADNSFIMGYITRNNLALDGYPFVKIESWNKQNDSIDFKFCFPIKEQHLGTHNEIKYAEFEEFEAMQILFNGNYSKSHRAWYAFEDYFEENRIKRKVLPTEVFLNDPQLGGEDINWSARILIPLN